MSAANDGASPTYDGVPLAEALTDAERRLRAETILDVMRGLQDRATLAEILVISRCLKRLEVMSSTAQHPTECTRDRCAVACPLDQWCALDEALQLELTDLRLKIEHTDARDEDAARDIERDRAGMTGRTTNTVADDRIIPTTRETLDRQAPVMARLADVDRAENATIAQLRDAYVDLLDRQAGKVLDLGGED